MRKWCVCSGFPEFILIMPKPIKPGSSLKKESSLLKCHIRCLHLDWGEIPLYKTNVSCYWQLTVHNCQYTKFEKNKQQQQKKVTTSRHWHLTLTLKHIKNTQVPAGYICYWCTAERGVDTGCIISCRGPDKRGMLAFTLTELPALTAPGSADMLPEEHRRDCTRGRPISFSGEAGLPARLISHKCYRGATLTLWSQCFCFLQWSCI